MTSPALNAPLRSLTEAWLDLAEKDAERRPVNLTGYVNVYFYPAERLTETEYFATAQEAAEIADDCRTRSCHIRTIELSTRRILDLAAYGAKLNEEERQNARDDERHNRTLSSAAMGGR